MVGPMSILYQTTNVRVEVQEGASTARMTAVAVNQHMRAGQVMEPVAPQLSWNICTTSTWWRRATGSGRLRTGDAPL